MTISAHTMVTNPQTYGYPYLESIKSFMELADEVIVVNGACGPIKDDGSIARIRALDPKGNKIKIIDHTWNPVDWSWEELGYHLKTAYEACTGDWAFRFDCDYIFEPKDVDKMKAFLIFCNGMSIPPKGVTIRKTNFGLADQYFEKSTMPFIVNKGQYPKLTYGLAYSSPDFMTAIDPVEEVNGMPIGWGIDKQPEMLRNCQRAKLWCYDFTFMTVEQVDEIRGNSYYAQIRYENPNTSCDPKEVNKIKRNALGKFRKQMIARIMRPDVVQIPLEEHPPVMHDKLRTLNQKMFGYNAFGWLKKKCDYIK